MGEQQSIQRVNPAVEEAEPGINAPVHERNGKSSAWPRSLKQLIPAGEPATSDAYKKLVMPGRRWTPERVEKELLGDWPGDQQYQNDLAASISGEKIREVLKQHAGTALDHPYMTVMAIFLLQLMMRAIEGGVKNRNPVAVVALFGAEGVRRYGLLGVAGIQLNAWLSAVEAMKGDRTVKLEAAQTECALFVESLLLLVVTKGLGAASGNPTRAVQPNASPSPLLSGPASVGQLPVPIGGQLSVIGAVRAAKEAVVKVLQLVGITAPLVSASRTEGEIDAAMQAWMEKNPISGSSQELDRQVPQDLQTVSNNGPARIAQKQPPPRQAALVHFSEEDLQGLSKELEFLKDRRDEMSESFLVSSFRRVLNNLVYDDTVPDVEVVAGELGDRLVGHLNPMLWSITIDVRRIGANGVEAPIGTIANELAQAAYRARQVILAGRLAAETTKEPSAIEKRLGVHKVVADSFSYFGSWGRVNKAALTSEERRQAKSYLDSKPRREKAMDELSAAEQRWLRARREAEIDPHRWLPRDPAVEHSQHIDHRVASERLREFTNFRDAQRAVDELPGQADIIAAGTEAEQFFTSAQIPSDGLLALTRSVARSMEPIVSDWKHLPVQRRLVALENLINDALTQAVGNSEVPRLKFVLTPGEFEDRDAEFDSKTWTIQIHRSSLAIELTQERAAGVLTGLVTLGRQAEQMYRSAIHEHHYENLSREEMIQSGHSATVVDFVKMQRQAPLSRDQTKSYFDCVSPRGALREAKVRLDEQRKVAFGKLQAKGDEVTQAMGSGLPVPPRLLTEFTNAMQEFEKARADYDRVSGHADSEKAGVLAGSHYLQQTKY